MKSRTKWEDKDIEYLKLVANDGNVTQLDISKKLERTVSAIRTQYKKMGIKKKLNRGTNLIGATQGCLIVKSYSHSDSHNRYYNCYCVACNCSKILPASTFQVKKGRKILSCGCQNNQQREKSFNFKGYKELPLDTYKGIVRQAIDRGYEFNISIEELWNLFEKQNRTCALSNRSIGFARSYREKNNTTASLDRINSNRNYTLDNVQWVHKEINFMKGPLEESKFKSNCKDVYDNSKDKKETIAVWGGCGFIGSVLIGRLLNSGYSVKVFDNLHKSIDGILQYFNNPKFSFEKLDITIEDDVKKSFDFDYSGILLLSGIVGVPACNQDRTLATIVNDTGWRLLCSNKPKDIRLVACGTGSVYGAVLDGLCTETIETVPLSHYGITKLAGESHVLNAGGISFRFATAAGVSPKMRLNLLPNYMSYHAVKDGYLNIFEPDNMRTFIDIRDFADSLIFGLENFSNMKYQIYNVGDENNNWSKRQLAQYIKSKTGCHLSYNETEKDADARNYAVSYERINESGFKCKYSIKDTIDHLLQVVPYISETKQQYE